MKLNLIICLTLAFSSTMAFADRTSSRAGWFAGGGVGSGEYDTDESLDSSATTLTAFGGYRFNRYLAVQGNVVDLGSYEGDNSVLRSVDLFAISATANGILPLGDSGFELYGRAGIAILEYTQTFEFAGWERENSSSGDALMGALGMAYRMPWFERLTLHAEFAKYYFETTQAYTDDEDTESHRLGVFEIAAQFNF